MRRKLTQMKKEKNMDMQISQLKTYKYLKKKKMGTLKQQKRKIKYKQ
jgi:hypothetical protein